MKKFFGVATLILSAIAGYFTVTHNFPLIGIALTLGMFAKGTLYLLESDKKQTNSNHKHEFILNWSDGDFWAECECGEAVSLESNADRESAYEQMRKGDKVWVVE